MTAEDFIRPYEEALASQQWAAVEPLVHENACVTFSNGTVHLDGGNVGFVRVPNGRLARGVPDPERTLGPAVTRLGEDVSVYVFDFAWSGRIDGRDAKGAGRGTSVLVRRGSRWQLLAEHLGPTRSPGAV